LREKSPLHHFSARIGVQKASNVLKPSEG